MSLPFPAPPPRAEVSAGLPAEYRAFADLVAGLSPTQWTTPTRCAGWQVRHVAGHVLGQAVDLCRGTIGDRTPDQQARDLCVLPAATLAGQLSDAAAQVAGLVARLDDEGWAAPSPVPPLTMGTGVLFLWSDAYVHGDDVRAALGLPPRRGAALDAAVHRYAGELRTRGWGPARLRLDGIPELAFGDGGPIVTGDPLRFVLAAAGRLDPATLGLSPSMNVYG
jgi:uncharacterized protein (TIGR03083 family)